MERLKEARLFNIEAEHALLGAVLMNNESFEKISDILTSESFYDPAHSTIYNAMATLLNQNLVADVKTLRGFFDSQEELKILGGVDYLAQLAGSFVNVKNIKNYASLIQDLFERRQLVLIADDIFSDATNLAIETSAKDAREEAEEKLFKLAECGHSGKEFLSLEKGLTSAIYLAQEAFKRGKGLTGVTSGLIDLDEKLGGFQDSDLIIIAGRPSMGKTALATNIAINAAKACLDSDGDEGAAVALFSLEMSAEQLSMRMLGEFSKVPSEKIRRGQIKIEDFPKFLEASKLIAKAPLFIDDSQSLTVAALRTKARRLKRLNPKLGLIVIDYLQLMQGSKESKKSGSRVQEISEITRGLKALAKELNLPVIALSQLSRGVENREEKKPLLSDLRESGSIEQDADVVLFVYREEYYHERSEPTKKSSEGDQQFNDRYNKWIDKGKDIESLGEVIIAKQRHGSVGSVHLAFDGQFTKFSNLEKYRE